jgi:hypothetical protein
MSSSEPNQPIAEEALRRIVKLYYIEANIVGHSAELCQRARKDHAVPILNELKAWSYEQRRRLSAKSHLANARQYTLTCWNALTQPSGPRAAVLYTLFESAKLNELNPEAYLADVIDRTARGHPINRLSELLPWHWKQGEVQPAD